MTDVQREFLNIARLQACGYAPPEPLRFAVSPKDVTAFARFQGMGLMAADFYLKKAPELEKRGMIILEESAVVAEGQKSGLRQFNDAELYKALMFDADLGTAKKIFNELKIDFIPLKGAVMRGLYPEKWMRQSTDIDVLVRGREVRRAADALRDKGGFALLKEGRHHFVMSGPTGWILELHHSLSGEDTPAGAYLKRVWEFARPASGHEHALPDEFFHIYHLSHMAGHFGGGGCGVRPFLDLHIMNGVMKAASEDMLSSVGLGRFSHVADALSEKWFGDAGVSGADEMTLRVEEILLGGGLFGSKENEVLLKRSVSKSRAAYLKDRLILPAADIKSKYPAAARHGFLVPFYQLGRWFSALSPSKSGRVRSEVKITEQLTDERISHARRLLRGLGIEDYVK